MEKESLQNARGPGAGLIRSVIEESRKIRAERGEDFYSAKKSEAVSVASVTTKIQNPAEEKGEKEDPEKNFQSLRESHVKLAHLVLNYDKKIFEQNNQVLDKKKPRSKSVHLYIDEEIESFLNTESQKAETKWKLRKNAGLGCLISKFIGNFIELKKREEKQLTRVKKLIGDFKSGLVEFKKYSGDPDDYQNAERFNQKLKVLSSDLNILLSLLEFENESLKSGLGADFYEWVDFVLKWKYHS